MPTSRVTHDITLSNTVRGGSVNMGLLLAEDTKKRKMWDAGYAPTIAPQQTQGLPIEADKPLDQEISWTQQSWHGGLVGENDYDQKGVVYCATGDTRWKGGIVNPPKINTILNSANTRTTVNSSFETLAAPEFTGWTRVNYTAVQAAGNGTTYAARMINEDAAVSQLTQPLYMRGLTGTLSASVKTTTASLMRIGVDTDGAGTMAWSSYHTGSGNWETLSVEFTCTAGASGEKIVIEHANIVGTGDVDLVSVTCPIANSAYAGIKFLEHKTGLYLLLTKAFFKWDNTNSCWDLLRGAGTNSFTDAETFNSNIYLAHGDSAAIEYSSDDGVTWTNSTMANDDFTYLRSYGTYLWGFQHDRALRVNSDPVGTAWPIQVNIGDTTWHINGIAGLGNKVLVGKENEIFQIDSTTTVLPLMTSFRTLQDADNCKGMSNWNEYIFIPVQGGLYVYDGTSMVDISVTKKSVNSLGYLHSTAMYNVLAGDSQWLYIFTSDGYLYTLRLETIEGTVPETDWRWHLIYNTGYLKTEASVAITAVYCAIVSKLQADTGRLWFWEYNGTIYNASYILLSGLETPTNASVATFKSIEDYVYTPWWDYGFPAVNKAFLSLNVKCRNVTGSAAGQMYVSCYYAVDNGALKLLTSSSTSIALTNADF